MLALVLAPLLALEPATAMSAPVGATNLEGGSSSGNAARVDTAELRWYGGPAVAADVASSAFLVWGLASPDGSPIIPGAVGYALGAPVNHLAHGHPGRAAMSLGVRLLAGGLAAPAVWNHILVCDAPPCRDPAAPLTLATIVGLGAMIFDDAFLAREVVPAETSTRTLITPGVVAAPGLAFFSLGGRF
jgi:hypothetical protein